MARIRLSELLSDPVQVSLGNGKSFAVEGLQLEDLSFLFIQYREDIITLFDSASKGGVNAELVASLAPKMLSTIIAMGAGIDRSDPKEMLAVERISLGVKLVALSEIWRATIPEPKKLEEVFRLLAKVLNDAVAEFQRQKPPVSGTTTASLPENAPS